MNDEKPVSIFVSRLLVWTLVVWWGPPLVLVTDGKLCTDEKKKYQFFLNLYQLFLMHIRLCALDLSYRQHSVFRFQFSV